MDTKSLGLNAAQLLAVTAPMGPVLILAGAGSGKTRALTMRIVYLIKKIGISPHNILAVTFTNKAAGEMKERIMKILGKGEKGVKGGRGEMTHLPTMGTFHSIGVRILRVDGQHVGLGKDFVIYDGDDQESLLKDIMLSQKIDPTKLKPSLFAHIIDRAKNNMMEPEDLEEKDKKFEQTTRTVYRMYQEQMKQNNAVDFGDLLTLPVKLFREHPEILEKYQNLWKYILVDEYQDTNQVQYSFAKMLAAKHKNIFVVGDDAQAIYGFRGANLQNILDFEDDYKDCLIIRLEQNYRSTAPILAVAEKVIELNSNQHKKRLITDNTVGSLPVMFAAEDEMAEAYFVANEIIKIQDRNTVNGGAARIGLGQGGADSAANPDTIRAALPNNVLSNKELSYQDEDAEYKEEEGILARIMRQSQAKVLPKLKNRIGLNNISVLYRTHFQSRAFEEAFISASIPYQIVGGLKFYERAEIKDVLCYLRLVVNPNDLVSLKRVINKPARGVGPKTFELLKEALMEKNEKLLGEIFAKRPAIKTYFETLSYLSGLEEQGNILDVLKVVLKSTGYEQMLRDGSGEGETRWENVQELFNVATSFRKFPWKEGLQKFLEEVALMTSADEVDLDSPKVTLMTLHQAKGLEYDTVFLVGLEEGILPHARSVLDPKDIAEEVRLMYVGVTRARKKLYLIHAQTRRQYGSRNMSVKSRILKAVPEELLDVRQGIFN